MRSPTSQLAITRMAGACQRTGLRGRASCFTGQRSRLTLCMSFMLMSLFTEDDVTASDLEANRGEEGVRLPLQYRTCPLILLFPVSPALPPSIILVVSGDRPSLVDVTPLESKPLVFGGPGGETRGSWRLIPPVPTLRHSVPPPPEMADASNSGAFSSFC